MRPSGWVRVYLQIYSTEGLTIVPFYAISRQDRTLSLYSWTQGNFRCSLKGALKRCVRTSDRGGFIYPARSLTLTTSPECISTNHSHWPKNNWEWGCFHGSGKNIDNNVLIYWITWHIEPELQWQVRLIQKLHSDWNTTHVSPKRRRKQCTVSTVVVIWLTTMTRLCGLPT